MNIFFLGKGFSCRSLRMVPTSVNLNVNLTSPSHSTSLALRRSTKEPNDFRRTASFHLHRCFGTFKRSRRQFANAVSAFKSGGSFERNGRKYHDDIVHDRLDCRLFSRLRVWEHARSTDCISMPQISIHPQGLRWDRDHNCDNANDIIYNSNRANIDFNFNFNAFDSSNDWNSDRNYHFK